MTGVAAKVAVIGSGISGAVCASMLVKNGIPVTIFESARGPGGRMSQRREVAEDGRELLFDHGAPYFTITNAEVLRLVHEWESRGLVALWDEKFGSFDCVSKKFLNTEEIPVKVFSFTNSDILSWAFCESSKPGRSAASERWVLHSTVKYAEGIITGLQKLSTATLTKIAEELFQEFQSSGLSVSQPFFKKAHRWDSAFPGTSIAPEEKCVWNGKKRLAICGDFCVSPNVESAISSGVAAASKFVEILSSL